MISRLLLLTFTALGCLCGLAQDNPPNPVPPAKPVPVKDSIQQFFDSLSRPAPADEVVSQFSPPAQPPPPATPETTPPVATEAPTAEAPAAEAPTAEAPAAEPSTADPATPTDPQASLTVQVEKLQTGKGVLDPKSVKLRAPFPAKPLAAIPAGWRLKASTNAQPFLRKVELAPGASITLTIRPHQLVPDADGTAVFSIAEPGFDPALGYRQAQTVSAILATSIQQLDEDAKQLGHAIDQLQQLVSSLPQPAPKPLPPPAVIPTVLPVKPSPKK